jgi:hypothetical protein
VPFESLSCTNCGSGDVQEVKPDTYFCNNCEQVFKYVEPSPVIVNDLLAQARLCDCESGYPVGSRYPVLAFPCQVCRGSVCVACEVSGTMLPLGPSDGVVLIMPTPADGFGYLMDFSAPKVDQGVSSSRLYSLTGGRFRQVNEGGRIGPFLYTGDVVAHIAASLDRAPNEVYPLCLSCATAAIPAAAEEIADGFICEHPRCVNRTQTQRRCRCCSGAFCEQHVNGDWAESVTRGFTTLAPVIRLSVNDVGVQDLFAHTPGLCVGCSDERYMEAQKKYCAICDVYLLGFEKRGTNQYNYQKRQEVWRKKFESYEKWERRLKDATRAQSERAGRLISECIAKIEVEARGMQRRQGGCSRVEGSGSARYITLLNGTGIPPRPTDWSDPLRP